MASSDTGWQQHVNNLLFYTASMRQCISYAELAEQARVPAPHRIHTLTDYLELLIRQDAKDGKPLRACVAISKVRDGLPGNGFFSLCTELGLMIDTLDRREFHQTCLDAIFKATSQT